MSWQETPLEELAARYVTKGCHLGALEEYREMINMVGNLHTEEAIRHAYEAQKLLGGDVPITWLMNEMMGKP